MKRQQLIITMIIIAGIIFQSNFCLSDEIKEKYKNVRLNQNEWVQILEQKEYIEFNEKVGLDVWELHVKVVFLQYCKASKKKSSFEEIINDPNATDKEIGKALNETLMSIDHIVPMFRCNYRTTIFLTEYSPDGKELSTKKTIPIAPKNKTEIIPGETIWVTFYSVIDPPHMPKPKSWHVWVPK